MSAIPIPRLKQSITMNDKQIWTIYAHKNKINNKIYIGQTCKNPPERRWQNGNGYSNQIFYRAIQKYGWENFEHIIIEPCHSQEEANQKEQYWINYYHSNNPNFGYNQTKGGNNAPISEETKQRIKDFWTTEKRKEQSERMTQIWLNDNDRKKKQSELMIKLNKQIDRTKENNPMYGKKRSGINAGYRKPVICLETGEEFATITDAAKWAGSVSLKSHISAVCKGKRKTSGKHPVTKEPLHWKYKKGIF